MKLNSIFLSAVLLLLVNSLSAQFPPLSPRGKVQQTVGNTNVTIEYSRPAARGREIFGGLVPWDELWITGGGNEPIITFDREVTFGDDLIPAGKYHLLTIPGQKEWVVLLISDKSTSAIMKIDERFVSARFCTPTLKAGRFYDSFSLDLDISEDNARLFLSWTDVQVFVPIKTSTETRSIALIDSLLAAPFSAAADEQYARATNYLLFNHRDGDKAIALLANQIKIEEREYLYRMLFDAHLIKADSAGALATMDKAIKFVQRRFADHPFAAEESMAYWKEARKKIKLTDFDKVFPGRGTEMCYTAACGGQPRFVGITQKLSAFARPWLLSEAEVQVQRSSLPRLTPRLLPSIVVCIQLLP